MDNNRVKVLKNLSLFGYIGLAMILPIALGVWIGNKLDEKLNTGNVFLIVCIGISVPIAFISVYRIVMKDIKKD